MEEAVNEPISPAKWLPESARDLLQGWIETYGPDAVVHGIYDICAKKARLDGPDSPSLTAEQRREARLWGFARNDAERFLRAIQDHGPGSGCK